MGDGVAGIVVDGRVEDDDSVLLLVAVSQNVAHVDQGHSPRLFRAELQGSTATLQGLGCIANDAVIEPNQNIC